MTDPHINRERPIRAGNSALQTFLGSRPGRTRHLIIIGALALCCLLHGPLLGRPMGASHEWLAAHTLNTHLVWRQVGLEASHFSLLNSFPTPADRAVSSDLLRDAAGNSYFVSFPPLAFLLAHAYFQVTSLPPTPGALRILGIIIQLVTSWLFYLIARRVMPERPEAVLTPALVAFLVCLFNPLASYVFCNNYFPVTLVQPFWLAAIYFLLIYLETRKVWSLGAFVGASFAACYTEWTADLFLFSVVLYALTQLRSSRPWRALAAGSVGVVMASNALVVWQNSRIAGLQNYFHALWNRYADRSGMFAGINPGLDYFSVGAYVSLVKHYLRGFGPVLLLAMALLAILFVAQGAVKGTFARNHPRLALTFLLLGLPVVLDHGLLFNHAVVHDYTALKAVAFISLLVGVLVGMLEAHFAELPGGAAARLRMYTLCLATVILCIPAFMVEYYRTPPAWDDMRLGLSLKQTARPTDALLMLSSPFLIEENPIVAYYSGRDFRVFDAPCDMLQWARSHPDLHAALVKVDSSRQVSSYSAITQEEIAQALPGCPSR